jgi:8-oxo-dGTP diphosphatase
MTDPYQNVRLPRLTVDAWIRDAKGRVLLVQRGRPPFLGAWGLPGGFCEWGETTEACCAREALEETGLTVGVGALLGVYSRPDRDPRGHNVTVLYECRVLSGKARGDDDAADARWFTPADVSRLSFAFDHGAIIAEQLSRRSGRSRRSRPSRQPEAGPSRRERPGGPRGSASRARRRT